MPFLRLGNWSGRLPLSSLRSVGMSWMAIDLAWNSSLVIGCVNGIIWCCGEPDASVSSASWMMRSINSSISGILSSSRAVWCSSSSSHWSLPNR